MDNLGAVARQGIAVADTKGGSDWNGSTRLGVDYYFDLGVWQPYAGATIGYIYGDNVKDSFIAGPEAGVKYFVNETTYLNAGVEYDFIFDDANNADDGWKDGRFVYSLGIGFKF